MRARNSENDIDLIAERIRATIRFQSSIQLALKQNKNLAFWIHEPTSPPRIENWDNHDFPFIISNESMTSIGIENTSGSKLAEPYNSCPENTWLFEGNRTTVDYISSIGQSYKKLLRIML